MRSCLDISNPLISSGFETVQGILVGIKAVAIDLEIAKETMEELCDWHACNVIDEAERTMNKAVEIIKGKLEEINND